MTTQVGFGPLQRVDGPPPIPPKFGLLQAAAAPAAGVRIIPEGDDRFLNGVEVFPYPPDTADVIDACAPGSVATTLGFGTDLKHPQFGALTVWLAETCTTSHIWDQDEYRSRAVTALTAVESAGVAHELMTGARIPANPHLADGQGTYPNGNTVMSVILALALLENEIAKSGRLGLIHCSPGVAMIARDRFALDDKTGVLRTINGTVVIPDAGYAPGYVPGGTGASGFENPAGHPGATGQQEWIYATGPIDIRRSELFTMPETVDEALDRGMGATNGKPNAITYRAERYYVVDWDTVVQAAVLVDKSL